MKKADTIGMNQGLKAARIIPGLLKSESILGLHQFMGHAQNSL